MPIYAPPHALRGQYLYEQWRPDLVRAAAALLLLPPRLHASLSAPLSLEVPY
jgi:hypothetical protein